MNLRHDNPHFQEDKLKVQVTKFLPQTRSCRPLDKGYYHVTTYLNDVKKFDDQCGLEGV